MNGPSTGRAVLPSCLLVCLCVIFMPLPTAAEPVQDDYASVIARQEADLLRFLRAFEKLQEQLHPAKFTQLQADLSQTVGDLFVRTRSELNTLKPPPDRQDFHRTWLEAVGLLDTTYGIFVRSDQAGFYRSVYAEPRSFHPGALSFVRNPLGHARTAPLLGSARGGGTSPQAGKARCCQQHRVGISHHPPSSNHGAYSLYVPENYDPQRHWPLIIALHGAGGANDEYLLTWLRPAKSKGYIVLAPKSLGPTWAIEKPEPDVVSVTSTLMVLRERYAIDPTGFLSPACRTAVRSRMR